MKRFLIISLRKLLKKDKGLNKVPLAFLFIQIVTDTIVILINLFKFELIFFSFKVFIMRLF